MTPRQFRAPGRVNLIGEHTDYNDGFVLPAALHFSATATLAEGDDNRLRVTSAQETAVLDIAVDEDLAPRQDWTDYVSGIILELRKAGIPTPAAHIHITSDVPSGAGLSSSAALEISAALALLAAANWNVPKLEIAKIAQQAEIDFVGTRCGIMDQFISLFAEPNAATLLDCRSLAHGSVSIPAGVSLVIANTMVKHSLAHGEYNKRRENCERAAAALGVKSLRDVDSVPAGDQWNRARHVVEENKRVLAFVQALRASDLKAAASLMEASHASLRDLYEVSCPELDAMASLAKSLSGYHGARMTGGGFGGCTVNLVDSAVAEKFHGELSAAYQSTTGIIPEIYITQPGGPAAEIRDPRNP